MWEILPERARHIHIQSELNILKISKFVAVQLFRGHQLWVAITGIGRGIIDIHIYNSNITRVLFFFLLIYAAHACLVGEKTNKWQVRISSSNFSTVIGSLKSIRTMRMEVIWSFFHVNHIDEHVPWEFLCPFDLVYWPEMFTVRLMWSKNA